MHSDHNEAEMGQKTKHPACQLDLTLRKVATCPQNSNMHTNADTATQCTVAGYAQSLSLVLQRYHAHVETC